MNREQEHFSEEQITVIQEVFHDEANKVLIKLVAGNLVAFFIAIGAISVGWYRLENVETNLSAVVKSMSEGPRFTQVEGDALQARHDQDVANLQRQIDGTTARLERMENKIDLILNRI